MKSCVTESWETAVTATAGLLKKDQIPSAASLLREVCDG